MRRIEGEKEVRDYLVQEIATAEKALLSDISGIAREFLTLVLGILDGSSTVKIPGCASQTAMARSVLDIKQDLVQMLDTLLTNHVLDTIQLTPPQQVAGIVGNVTVGTVHPRVFERCTKALFKHFELISRLKTLLLQCELSGYFAIEIQKNGSPAFETRIYRNARLEWLENSIRNTDWEDYFFVNPSNDLNHFAYEISNMLKAKHGFTLQQLQFIASLLELMDEQRKSISVRVSSPIQFDYLGRFTTLPRDSFYEPLRSEFKGISDREIDALLDAIEYGVGKLPTQAPFFPIRRGGRTEYFVWTSAPGFEIAWLTDVLKQGGSLGKRYGDEFEKYVRERLRDRTVLQVEPSGLEVTKVSYGDIAKRFEHYDREKIQIDALATNKDCGFVISCKAHDLFFDQERYARLLVSPYSNFYSRTLNNYHEVLEVCLWVDILQSSGEFIAAHGLQGKKLVPLLVTPRRDPLQFESVRTWFAGIRPFPSAQSCEVLSISDLEEKFRRT